MSAMNGSAKVPFRVIKCSSYDDGYDHTQLETTRPTRHTKGWQSARFCEFPQTLVLDFRKTASIRKIQILSHQSKIASQIEIYCGVSKDHSGSMRSAEWTRLGYMSLDSNERSNYKARELKSVYVHARGRWLKLVLKKAHVNTINLFNQVGIVCVNVVGPTTKDQEQPLDDLATGMAVDETTQHQLQEFHRRKAAAIEREDYEEAKRLKAAIEGLKQIGGKISDLERLKRIAVQNEDYDRANDIKLDIARIRRDGVNGLAKQGLVRTQGHSHPQPQQQQHHYDDRAIGGGQADRGGPPADQGREEPAEDPYMKAHPPQKQQQQQQQPERPIAQPVNDPYDRPLNNNNNNGRPAAQLPAERPLNVPAERPLNVSSAPRNEGPERPLPVHSNDSKSNQPAEFAPNSKQPSGNAEALSAKNRNEAEPYIALFGQRIVQEYYSKQWGLREGALKQIQAHIKRGDGNASGKVVFMHMCKMLAKTLQDKVVQVFAVAIETLQFIVNTFVPVEYSSAEATPMLQSLVSILIDNLGASNARMSKLSAETISFLTYHDDVEKSMMLGSLLRQLKKKDASRPGPIKGRLGLIADFIPALGLQDSAGFSAGAIMAFVLAFIEHRDGSVREAVIVVATEVFLQIGEKRMKPFLSKIRPGLVDTLQQSFDNAEKNGGTKKSEHKSRAPASKAAAKQEQHEVADDEPEQGFCQFCGQEDPTFTDEKLDMHYWQDCPILTSCKQCEQIIEIPTLHEHLLGECEVTDTYIACEICGLPVPKDAMDAHIGSKACVKAGPNEGVCPLCNVLIKGGDDGWRVHLLDEGCPNNPRSASKRVP
jgi:centrosomal protein CEP104